MARIKYYNSATQSWEYADEAMGSTVIDAVLFTEQNLSEDQKAQARANIEAANNPLYGKKVSFLGDSICAGADTEASYLGGYGKIIADRNNMAYENLGHGGATVTAETYSSSTGYAKPWLCRMVENMSADADYAIVEGGINDAWQWSDHKNIEIGELTSGYSATLDDTTYYGAFESMLKQLVTKFQGKKIGYIAVPKTMGLYDSNRNAPNFYHIALECCAKWGVPVCDLNTIIPPTEYLKTLGTTYTADGTHPTYEGYLKYYCDPIEAWMKTLTTGGSVPSMMSSADLDKKYVLKSDIFTKKAQLTLEDGTTVLIDVIVASEGTTIQKYTNQVPKSIDTDGSVYNGCGYEYGLRLSSSGVTKAQAVSYVTGYMPARAGDVIRIFGCGWGTNLNANNYICAYDSNFSFIGARSTSVTSGKTLTTYSTNILDSFDWNDNGDATLVLADVTNIAYIRINSKGQTASSDRQEYDIEDMIVTVNEEIT